MEHLFFQGTDRCRTTDDVVEPIVALGGSFNAATEREMIGFFVDAPATALSVAIEQVGDVLVNARFDEAGLKRSAAWSSRSCVAERTMLGNLQETRLTI